MIRWQRQKIVSGYTFESKWHKSEKSKRPRDIRYPHPRSGDPVAARHPPSRFPVCGDQRKVNTDYCTVHASDDKQIQNEKLLIYRIPQVSDTDVSASEDGRWRRSDLCPPSPTACLSALCHSPAAVSVRLCRTIQRTSISAFGTAVGPTAARMICGAHTGTF